MARAQSEPFKPASAPSKARGGTVPRRARRGSRSAASPWPSRQAPSLPVRRWTRAVTQTVGAAPAWETLPRWRASATLRGPSRREPSQPKTAKPAPATRSSEAARRRRPAAATARSAGRGNRARALWKPGTVLPGRRRWGRSAAQNARAVSKRSGWASPPHHGRTSRVTRRGWVAQRRDRRVAWRARWACFQTSGVRNARRASVRDGATGRRRPVWAWGLRGHPSRWVGRLTPLLGAGGPFSGATCGKYLPAAGAGKTQNRRLANPLRENPGPFRYRHCLPPCHTAPPPPLAQPGTTGHTHWQTPRPSGEIQRDSFPA